MIDDVTTERPQGAFMPLMLAALCLEPECNTVFRVARLADDAPAVRVSACPTCGSTAFSMLSTWVNRRESGTKKPDESSS